MSLDRREVISALQTKGFTCDKTDRDHDYFFLQHEGLTRAIYTKVSRGSNYRTLGHPLVAAMSKQLQLTKREFLALVECSLSGEGYIDQLRMQGLIPQPKRKDGDAQDT